MLLAILTSGGLQPRITGRAPRGGAQDVARASASTSFPQCVVFVRYGLEEVSTKGSGSSLMMQRRSSSKGRAGSDNLQAVGRGELSFRQYPHLGRTRQVYELDEISAWLKCVVVTRCSTRKWVDLATRSDQGSRSSRWHVVVHTGMLSFSQPTLEHSRNRRDRSEIMATTE